MVLILLTGVRGRLITLVLNVDMGLVRTVCWGLVAGGVLWPAKSSPADPRSGDLSVSCVISGVRGSGGMHSGGAEGPRPREKVESVLVLTDIATPG